MWCLSFKKTGCPSFSAVWVTYNEVKDLLADILQLQLHVQLPVRGVDHAVGRHVLHHVVRLQKSILHYTTTRQCALKKI